MPVPFNPLDWLLAAVLLYSTVRAALNGILRETFTLAGLVAGLLLASWYCHDLASYLAGLITAPAVALLASFFLILAAVTVLAGLLGRLFRRGARTAGLGALDRCGGAAFGLLRGAGVGAALLVGFTAFLPAAPWIHSSALAPYLLRGVHAVSFTMPPDLRFRLGAGMRSPNHSSAGWIKPGPVSHTGTTSLLP